ncbi:MAG: Fur family transcriptional regulator [bacterium]
MEEFIEILKKSGCKLTKNRKEIFEILLNLQKPISLKEIQNKCNNTDFASVYRIINLFFELKIVRKVNFGEKFLRYELETGKKHHHHLVCTKCGKVSLLDYCVVNEIEKLTKFKIEEHNMEFSGICPECTKE